jgi:predicted ArsR family transcriptional regulator
MHDTRWAVLETIKNQGQVTVAELAGTLGISAIAIRHHLTGLQAEGLVRVELQRQAVGRPRHIYSLTEAARRQIPNNYHVFAERLLDELKAMLSAQQVEAIIERMASNVAARHGGIPVKGTLEQRLEHLVEVLGEEGFLAAVRRIDDTTVLTELNCPFVYVGQRHPEICRIDHTIIRSVLGLEVQQTSCVLQGDRSCTFSANAEVSDERTAPADRHAPV